MLYTYMPLVQIKPVSPKSSNIPAPRKLSMTQVITPENSEAWQVASRAAKGSVLDASMLRAEATRYGAVIPGWIGESTQFVKPASNNG